jgi:predicted dehydrogenase
VGEGWRAAAYRRLGGLLEGLSCVRAAAFPSLDQCLAAVRPDFVVTAVPRTVNVGIVLAAVSRGIPVLSETPPGPDLSPLWPHAARVQVAEQYLLMPSHAARLAAVRAGAIGTPFHVHVSSTQLYHAVSLMRGYLDVPVGRVTVRATRHVAPLVDPLKRGGWTDDPAAKPATTTVGMLDFGGGRSGVYDFTDNQTRNLLRFRRLVVRGSRGELADDAGFVRRHVGHQPGEQGNDTVHIAFQGRILYRNPYLGKRLNDDEIAVATMLERTVAWIRGAGPPPYPLAAAAHDQAVGMAIEEAAATGLTVVSDDCQAHRG